MRKRRPRMRSDRPAVARSMRPKVSAGEAATSPHLLPGSRSGAGDRRGHRPPPGTPLHRRRRNEGSSKMLAYASDVGRFSFRGDSTMAQGPPLPCCGATQRRHQPLCRQELCPEKRMLYYPNLPKVIGSDYLERRLRAIHNNAKDGAACHVFGHTHFCWDSVLDNIRYVEAPLAYPRERKRRTNGGQGWLPFCVYRDGFNPEICPAIWSDY